MPSVTVCLNSVGFVLFHTVAAHFDLATIFITLSLFHFVLTSLVSHLGSFYFTSRTVFSFPLAQVCCDKLLQVSFIRKCLFHFHSRKILSLSIKPEPSGVAVHLLEHVVAVEIVTCESDYCSLEGNLSFHFNVSS